MHKNYCTNCGIRVIMSITKDDKCLSWVFYNFIRMAFYMEYTYRTIQDYFYNNNLHASDTIYNDIDSIAYVLCEVLTSQEKARARKAVKTADSLHLGTTVYTVVIA